MMQPRSAVAVILAWALSSTGSAQVIEGRLGKTGLSSVPQISAGALGSQVLSAPKLMSPALAAPSLLATPLAAPAVPAVAAAAQLQAAPAQTPAMKVSAVAAAVAPSLQALAAPDLKGEEAASAAEAAMAPVIGRSAGAGEVSVPASGQPWVDYVKAHEAEWRKMPDYSSNWYHSVAGPKPLVVSLRSKDRNGMPVHMNGVNPGRYRVLDLKLVSRPDKETLLVFYINTHLGVQTFMGPVSGLNGRLELRAGAWPVAASEAERMLRWQKAAGLYQVPEQFRASIESSLKQFEPAPAAAPAPAKAKRAARKSAPLLSQVTFDEAVSAEQRDLWQETMSRRKAGWTRELAKVGVKLNGPVSPTLQVRSATARKNGYVAFEVEWSQGETRVGKFRASLSAQNLNPFLSELAAPEPPAEKQLLLRFSGQDTDAAKFLESHALRLLSKDWTGVYKVAVTGDAQAEAVAKELSGQVPVLYATPATLKLPEANQVKVVFKKDASRHVGDNRHVSMPVNEYQVGSLLRREGLSVLEMDRYNKGHFTVGAQGLDAVAAAAKLQEDEGVLYASPMGFGAAAESSQLVVRFHEDKSGPGGVRTPGASEDDIAAVLRRHGLIVIQDLGGPTLKVFAAPGAGPVADLAARLQGETAVQSVTKVGSLSAEGLQSAVRDAVGHKGMPWSQTEYSANLSYVYWRLVAAGATAEQLELFEKKCDEAPVNGGRFNPWSGD